MNAQMYVRVRMYVDMSECTYVCKYIYEYMCVKCECINVHDYIYMCSYLYGGMCLYYVYMEV
jgi:hypothetical protein